MSSCCICPRSFSLSLAKQGRKGLIYLFSYLFDLLHVNQFLCCRPGRVSASGRMRGSGGFWMVAQNNSLPPSWRGKTVSQHWVSILCCWKKQSQACSLWAWSYLKTLPSLYCVGMGWLWRTLFWQSSASCMGALIFTYPAAHFVSFTSQLFSPFDLRDTELPPLLPC